MLRAVIPVFAVAFSLCACTTSSLRSQEGHACSTSSSDDPQLVCTPAQDLVCISTYTRVVTNPGEATKFDGGIRHVYVCRINCNTADDCLQEGDICCPGTIYGKTYGKMGGCTPPSACGALEDLGDDGGVDATGTDVAAPPDAPTPDAATPDAGATAADAGASGG
jgi:hypothetical protein